MGSRTLPKLLLLSWVVVGSGCLYGDTSGCEVWYADIDGDGYGNPDAPFDVCSIADEEGHVDNDLDCHDGNHQAHPEATEVCDNTGLDDDCNGVANDDDDGLVGGVETWADRDGDGFGDGNSAVVLYCTVPEGRSETSDDCDDGEAATFPGAAYFEDRTACMQDVDADGWGASSPGGPVDAGSDCDDTAATTHPGASEAYGDLVDQDCDGEDQWFLFDDIELGTPDPTVFVTAAGELAVSDRASGGYAHSGRYSLELGGDNSLVTTIMVDTSLCDTMSWSYWAKRGPSAPATADTLTLQFDDGDEWVDIDVWSGIGVDDPDFSFRSGPVDDPAARHSGLRLRLFSDGSAGGDQFFVDDFRFTCPGLDGDGDGFGALDDCDDADPAHWSDCLSCADHDGDGFGLSCDLGDDCDDADATIFFGAPDPDGDGIDQDCSGVDGPNLIDDFESGQPPLWWSMSGDFGYDVTEVFTGTYALRLGGGGAVVETTPMDMSACTQIDWGYWVKRGPEAPDSTDSVVFDYFDGSDWVRFDEMNGTSDEDPRFNRRGGTIAAADARTAGFKIRMTSNGTNTGFDDFFFDDVSILCR